MAYVLSSISGNLISAASAGYAPTNSGDVSAIASAYQVVSSTATQLYAGTAYVTSINDAPISAARAGNAANASLANSAWYDGTGRLISALPDSAAVSGIASAYAESAVSSKADSSAMSSYVPYSSLEYNTASAISGINGSALAAGSTYSAGEGIDITDDVISVEAPVDIVAGPGIVIDNPDGNTLRVSMATDYEVELYKHTTVAYTNVNDVFTMSEPITNFERIRIEFWNREFQFMRISFEYYVTDAVADSTQFVAELDASNGINNIQRVNMAVGFNASGNLVDKLHGLFYFNGGNYTNGNDRGLGIHRVVGIHRINGGN